MHHSEPLPHDHIDPKPDMWVQEEIFGHRFVADQLPFMLVLEALSVCRSDQIDIQSGEIYPDTRIFIHEKAKPDYHENLRITVPKQGPLRYLLFAAKAITEIREDRPYLSENELFDHWIQEINEGYRNAVKKTGVDTFSYLKKRFSSYCDCTSMLEQAIKILKGLQIDALNNRRWTSKFLVPNGPHLLFHDMDGRMSVDRRFFGRGGEMVYLMLNRSQHAKKLAPLIHRIFFPDDNQLNRIAKLLSCYDSNAHFQSNIGYLPLLNHPSYDRLAEDWIAILDIPGTDPAQALRPLSDMTALNLVCYFIERAGEILGNGLSNETFKVIPLDVSDGGNRKLRSIAKEYLKRIKNIIDQAVVQHIHHKIEKTSQWRNLPDTPKAESRSNLAREAIIEAFNSKKITIDDSVIRSPEEWRDHFVNMALKRTHNQTSRLIEPLGKHAGFITGRRSIGTWLNASDEFLESMVLANVSKPMTVWEFLDQIYRRYGLVIGPSEARSAFPGGDIDITLFEANMQELERRLQGLGFVRRLSDDVAFVFNPYDKEDI